MSDSRPEGGRRALLGLLAPARRALIAAAAIQAVAAAASIVPFVAVVEIARRLLDPPTVAGDIRPLVVLAVVAFGVRLVAQGAAGQITHLADNTFQREVRGRMLAQLGRAPLGWFGERHSGEVRRAVHDDVNAMHYMVAHSLPDLVAGVVAPALALAYLAAVDWRLALVTVVPLLAFGLLYRGIVRGYADQMAGHSRALGRLSAATVEFVQGISVVKAFGRTGRAHARFRERAEEFADHHDRWVEPIARRSALAEVAISAPVILLVVLAGGVVLVRHGGLAPVDVIPFALLGVGLAAPLATLGYSAQGFRLAMDAAGRVDALLAVEPLPEPLAADSRAAEGRDVAMHDVSFSFDGSHRVLDGVDLRLEPGTVTALVGASGAGKSTLAALIPRFWDPDSGRVEVGGVDVRDMLAADLYGRVAFVFQDPGLVRASVRDNIALAVPGAPDEAVVAAARAARIDERIRELPRGYASVVGEDARLSGGEAQRVAIARALLADRPILVLDEATAFADPESEAEIQDALSELAAGRTLVVIAHRLSTVAGADQIVVMGSGRVLERGRHEELLAAEGAYARLWGLHLAGAGGVS